MVKPRGRPRKYKKCPTTWARIPLPRPVERALRANFDPDVPIEDIVLARLVITHPGLPWPAELSGGGPSTLPCEQAPESGKSGA